MKEVLIFFGKDCEITPEIILLHTPNQKMIPEYFGSAKRKDIDKIPE